MSKDYKKLLIVDDSEIDRLVLQTILWDEFDIIEASNGYEALEIITAKANELDAIMLDVSMPVIDGFGVLKLMNEKGINNIPVFLISAEATKDNVAKAAQFNISEFIVKPFERNVILNRLQARLGIVMDNHLSDADIRETNRYISDLKSVYDKYLLNMNKDIDHCQRVSDLMKILLSKYVSLTQAADLERPEIDVISKAAYFVDIGDMLFPSDEHTNSDHYQNHTVLGADIIRLNHSENCEYFVYMCSDMCIHHHERYDGKGYPYRVSGEHYSIYSQMCSILQEFDVLYHKYQEYSANPFESVMGMLSKDKGAVSSDVLSLLESCRANISMYYNSKL